MTRFARAMASIWLALAPTACAAADLAPPPAALELSNPSFDEPAADATRPAGWGSQGSQHGSARVVDRDGATGGRALELSPSSSGSTGSASFMVYQVLDAVALRGKTLEFGARVSSEGAGVNLVLWSPQGMGNEFDAEVDRPAWVDRSSRFTVPKDATILTFGVQVLGPQGGKAWVDDVFVHEVGKGNATVAKSAQSSSAAASPATGNANASVRIHTGEPARTLSRDFFAHHVEWVEDAQGLVKPGTGTLDENVMRLLDPIHIPLLRFPGGIMADFYDWKKGIGPQSERGEIRNPFNKKPEPIRFGSSEFIALTKRLGARACITANYGTGTPAMAGEWAKWFVEQGVRPECWEVGNEIYLSGPKATGPNSSAIYKPGSQYAKDWPAFAAAIHSALPDAEVGAIAHLDTGAFPFADGGNPDWTVKMLDALGTKVDFFALHNGYAPVILDDSVDLTREEDRRRMYRAMFAGAQQTADNLVAIGREIDRRSSVNAGVPFVITEFSSLIGISGKMERHVAYVDHTRTMASAVFTASVLDVYMADPRVRETMFTNPVHKWHGALVLADASGPVTSPTWELYRFYADRFEHGLVKTEVTTPTFASTTLGVVKARSSAPVLMARAGRSADGRRVTALLVNRAVEGDLTTELTFDGFVPKKISCQLLAAPLNATNGPVLSKSVQKGAPVKPREMSCTPSATQTLTLPAGSILSIVAES